MGQFLTSSLRTVVSTFVVGRDDQSMRVYALVLDCGHTMHRSIRATDGPKRTHCDLCAATIAAREAKAPRCRKHVGPLCVGCHKKPVRRRFGTIPPKRGWRIVDGVAWCWYCSEECSTRAMGLSNTGQAKGDGVKTMRADAAGRALERLTAACQLVTEPDGRVPVKAMLKVFMDQRRHWYSRGYSAGFSRGRRTVVGERLVS